MREEGEGLNGGSGRVSKVRNHKGLVSGSAARPAVSPTETGSKTQFLLISFWRNRVQVLEKYLTGLREIYTRMSRRDRGRSHDCKRFFSKCFKKGQRAEGRRSVVRYWLERTVNSSDSPELFQTRARWG